MVHPTHREYRRFQAIAAAGCQPLDRDAFASVDALLWSAYCGELGIEGAHELLEKIMVLPPDLRIVFSALHLSGSLVSALPPGPSAQERFSRPALPSPIEVPLPDEIVVPMDVVPHRPPSVPPPESSPPPAA
jgi:hypothetical protein